MNDPASPPEPRQDIRVAGNRNIVIVVGRDLLLRLRMGKGVRAAGALLALALAGPPAYRASGASWPEGKTALCVDGSFSESHARPGTCSHHGGVLAWRYPAGHPLWRHADGTALALAR